MICQDCKTSERKVCGFHHAVSNLDDERDWEADKLRVENSQLRRDLIAAKAEYGRVAQMCAELQARTVHLKDNVDYTRECAANAEEEVFILRGQLDSAGLALRRFGRHDTECGAGLYVDGGTRQVVSRRCVCGLSGAISAARAPVAQ